MILNSKISNKIFITNEIGNRKLIQLNHMFTFSNFTFKNETL